jgi:hypothetical protein
VRLAEVERAYVELLREREIRETLAAVAEAGAPVHYWTADVRDEAAVTAVV